MKRTCLQKILTFFLILFAGTVAFAQLKISGKVFTSENEPLAGASILIEGSTYGSITDDNGSFSIVNLKNETYRLKISFIGYRSYSTKVVLSKDVFLNVILQKTEIMTDEVFVYPTRAGSKTPVATSEISKSQIEAKNMGQDIPYLLNSTPSFISTSDAGTGIGYTGFRIRGTDANRINVSVNGIPLNDAESHTVYWVNMPDFSSTVDNIQVQRGVGTSTLGAASFGATINMQTKLLQKEAYGGYSGGVGSFNTFKNTFMAGSGLIGGNYSFDVRLSKITSDGFIDRAASNLKSFFMSGGYYSENSILKINVFSGNEKTYLAWNGVPSNVIDTMRTYNSGGEFIDQSGKVKYYDNETDNYRQDHYQLLFTQKFGEFINLNAALHFTHGEGYYEEYKADNIFAKYGLPNFIAGIDTITTTDLVRQKWLDNNFYGGTFSFNFQKEKSDFTLGAGWNEYDGQHFGKIIWASVLGDIEKDHEWYRGTGIKTDFNIYAKFNYSINEKLNLYADLQYRNINHSIDGIDDDLRDLTQDHNFDFFNPKLGVYYQPTSKSKAYLSWAVGHREPNRSNFTDADPNGKQPTFETLNDFEGGYSFQLSKFSAGVNVYCMVYKDQLVLTGEINDVGSAIMANVDDSYRAGIEIVAGLKILPNLTWDINATFSQNKILNFTEYVDTYTSDWEQLPLSTFELGITDIAFSPNVTANSIINYEPITNLEINLISQYVGKQFIDNSMSDDRNLDSYFVSNMKVSYILHPAHLKEIRFNLLVSNLFNEEYESNAWVYSYIYGGSRYKMDGYFPQAGINFMVGVDVRF